LLAEKFVQCVVGVNIFKKNCCVKNFSEYISVSDEAMTMLILSNNWDVWSEIARHEIATNPKNLPDIKRKKVEQCVSTQRFHIDGKGRGFSWSPEGKLYYNMCYQQIRNDRELNGKRFDEYFIGEMRTTEEANKRNRDSNKRKGTDNNENVQVVRCHNDFDEYINDSDNDNEFIDPTNTINLDNIKRYKC
jgi:hypothetical protein